MGDDQSIIFVIIFIIAILVIAYCIFMLVEINGIKDAVLADDKSGLTNYLDTSILLTGVCLFLNISLIIATFGYFIYKNQNFVNRIKNIHM